LRDVDGLMLKGRASDSELSGVRLVGHTITRVAEEWDAVTMVCDAIRTVRCLPGLSSLSHRLTGMTIQCLNVAGNLNPYWEEKG